MNLSNKQRNMLNGGVGLLYLAFIITCLLILSYGMVGCAMNVHKPTVYKGKVNAVKPYVDMGKMHTDIHSCDSKFNTCMATMYITPHIHNTTKYFLEGKVHCKFSVTTGDAWMSYHVKSKSGIIILGPRKSSSASVKVNVKGAVEVPGNVRSSVTSSCWFRYKRLTSDRFLGPRLL